MSQYTSNALTPSVAAGMGRCAFSTGMTEAQLVVMFRPFGHAPSAAIVQCAVKAFRKAEAEALVTP